MDVCSSGTLISCLDGYCVDEVDLMTLTKIYFCVHVLIVLHYPYCMCISGLVEGGLGGIRVVVFLCVFFLFVVVVVVVCLLFVLSR